MSVLVTNTHVEYYDAKGTPSEEAVFEDGHTLRDLLDVCAGIGHREGRDVDIREVVEFPLIQQTDRHSCGVHSSLFYYLRLVEGWSFSDFFEHRIDASTIRLFRQHIMREIAQQYPVGSP